MARCIALSSWLLLIAFANTLSADFVTQSFTGVITAVNSGGQSGTPIASVDGISIGTTFTATFGYQTANSGADTIGNTSQGRFSISPSVETFLILDIGGKVFQKSAAGTQFVETFNNVTSTLSANTDLLSIFAGGPLMPAGWSVSLPASASLRATFADGSGLAMPSDALPNSFSPLWAVGVISQSFADNVTTPSGVINQLYIEGSLNISAVPEPCTTALFGLTAVGFVYRNRRRSRSKT